jgi:hypothetical protein
LSGERQFNVLRHIYATDKHANRVQDVLTSEQKVNAIISYLVRNGRPTSDVEDEDLVRVCDRNQLMTRQTFTAHCEFYVEELCNRLKERLAGLLYQQLQCDGSCDSGGRRTIAFVVEGLRRETLHWESACVHVEALGEEISEAAPYIAGVLRSVIEMYGLDLEGTTTDTAANERSAFSKEIVERLAKEGNLPALLGAGCGARS